MSVEFQVAIAGTEDFASKMGVLDEGMQEYIQRAVLQTTQEIMFRARQLAPVRSGRLMQSIYVQLIDKYKVKVGCYVPYALFQELGTSRISPRLFLTRALLENAPKLVSIMTLSLQLAAAEASV